MRNCIPFGFGKRNTNLDDKHPDYHKLRYSNDDVLRICKRENVSQRIKSRQEIYLGHIARYADDAYLKQLVYNADKYGRCGQPSKTLESTVLKSINQLKDLQISRQQFYDDAQIPLENRTDESSGDVSNQSGEFADT